MSESDLSKPQASFANARAVRVREERAPVRRLTEQPAISIKLLGAMSISAGGVRLPLPSSRKTRALLGYLILAEGPQRREHLCELLWELPDDPRGALRWSLSKLRPALNFDGKERLRSDREQVLVLLDDIDLDIHRIQGLAGQEGCTTEALGSAWKAAAEVLLDACEPARHVDFSAWLDVERQKVVSLRASFARRLALCETVASDEAVVWADRWLQDRPFDPEAAHAVVESRRKVGRIEEAFLRAVELEAAFREAGLQIPPFAGTPGKASLAQSKTPAADSATQQLPQSIRFVRARDNTCLAWACTGGTKEVPPLVKTAPWLTHLELDREASVWGSMYRALVTRRGLFRYDGRGCGLAEWDVPEISFEGFVRDLETVVDSAGLERFPLLGISEGAAVSIEYAARHPDRVSHLVLFGGYAAGWRHGATPAEIREREAVMVLAETGWGRPTASCPYFFSATFMPGASPEELEWFEELQRRSTSPRNAVRFLQAFSEIDVRHRLAELRVPTLVVHCSGDPRVPIAAGREMAAAIPGAKFVAMESKNHLLIGRDPAAGEYIELVLEFLSRTR